MMPTGTPTQGITKTKVTPTTINASATPIMARSHPAHPARKLGRHGPSPATRSEHAQRLTGFRRGEAHAPVGWGWAHPGGEVFIGANGCVGHAGRLAMLAIEPLTQMKGCKGRGEGQMRDRAVSITACRRVRRRAVSRSSLASRRQRPREAQADEGTSGPKSLGPSGLLCFLASRHPERAGRAPCSSPIPTCPRRPGRRAHLRTQRAWTPEPCGIFPAK
jgi:hypothetical protein